MSNEKPLISFSNGDVLDITSDQVSFSIFEGTWASNSIARVRAFIFELPDLVQIKFSPTEYGFGSYISMFQSEQTLIPAFIQLLDEMHETNTKWSIGEFSQKLLDKTDMPHTMRGGKIIVSKHNEPKQYVTEFNGDTSKIAKMLDSDIAAIKKLDGTEV